MTQHTDHNARTDLPSPITITLNLENLEQELASLSASQLDTIHQKVNNEIKNRNGERLIEALEPIRDIIDLTRHNEGGIQAVRALRTALGISLKEALRVTRAFYPNYSGGYIKTTNSNNSDE